jgi:hypothetical protein
MTAPANCKVPEDWTKTPKFSTRTELLEQRKKDILPDISYDLDQDGAVGGKDYLISKRFDLDGDGKLNAKEKANAIEAINSGYENQLIWGCDSSGVNRSFRIVQKRGTVVLNEEFSNITSTYPVFPSPESKTKTKTELDLNRKKEVKLLGKYYESKINKDYRVEITDHNQKSITPDTIIAYNSSYTKVPKFKTKNEMIESKKQQLVTNI